MLEKPREILGIETEDLKQFNMDVKKYQTIIEKTAIYPKEIGLAYCAMGLTGEAGEVADKIKKIYRDNTEVDVPAIAKELGDVLWYVTAMANELGVSLEEIMENNYNKLMLRRKTNTLSGSGDDREMKSS
jgi:NTP pyrophosphatase (non-canonical NTP hydrolase)